MYITSYALVTVAVIIFFIRVIIWTIKITIGNYSIKCNLKQKG